MRVRSLLALGGTAALLAGLAGALPAEAAAPVTRSYIVTLAPESAGPSTVASGTTALGGRVGFVYDSALHGFSVRLPQTALPALRAMRGVAAVEEDLPVSVETTQTRPPSYGLDRVDQRALPLSASYTYRRTGAGVTAYVIDTGIHLTHSDFGGRAVSGFDAVDGGVADDCNGHGTHVSGTIGGARAGVAKQVRLVAVRVLDCDGSGLMSGVIAGVDWVTRDHIAGRPAVANMSLAGPASAALDRAVAGSISDGVTYAVAAGNDGGAAGDSSGASNACNSSPSRVSAALTVGATDARDYRAPYSNSGSCLDLFAPGSDIVSDWYTSNSATQTISGTSMATPHVTGAAALYLQAVPSATPAQVVRKLLGASTPGKVKDPHNGSPNRLLYTRF